MKMECQLDWNPDTRTETKLDGWGKWGDASASVPGAGVLSQPPHEWARVLRQTATKQQRLDQSEQQHSVRNDILAHTHSSLESWQR